MAFPPFSFAEVALANAPQLCCFICHPLVNLRSMNPRRSPTASFPLTDLRVFFSIPEGKLLLSIRLPPTYGSHHCDEAAVSVGTEKRNRDGNLLKLMFSAKGDDPAVINAVFDIATSLLRGRLVERLGNEPTTVFMGLFALLPLYCNKCLTADDAQECADVLA
jgi:hypothetical protein